MDNPKYLYHYTNIETLALILKNRTIRFSSLNMMDDLQEQANQDGLQAAQHVFVSCWTDDSQESIPMWRMYSGIENGVRIKLPVHPFKRRPIDFNSLIEAGVPAGICIEGDLCYIPFSKLIKDNLVCFENMANNINLIQIQYTDDPKLLDPIILEHIEKDHGTDTRVSLGKLGHHKNTTWSFQREWRYILLFFPMNWQQPTVNDITNHLTQYFSNLVCGKTIMTRTYYDIDLSDEAFTQMEITLSPKISAGNREIATTLLEKYNSEATLKDSTLLGKLA